ncbi:MAG: hypothetical protein JKY11_00315 [Alphaproteobacteria bacterium]|nr:hypothetical protein [Alphaproteobacteria bacterium]
MNHIVISPPPEAPTSVEKPTAPLETSDVPSDTETESDIKKTAKKPIILLKQGAIQASVPKKEIPYFEKEEKLKEWPYLRELLSSNARLQSLAVKDVDKHPNTASPMVLLLVADYHSKHGDKEKAALYLYASKLRAQFDMKRWPIINESGLRARQKSHPAKETLILSKSISSNLAGWYLSKESRAIRIMKLLERWEKSTAYTYRPTYEIPSSVKEKEWKDIHDNLVKAFFAEQRNIIALVHPK